MTDIVARLADQSNLCDDAIAEIARLRKALANAPIISKYHGMRGTYGGFELERFLEDYEAWRKHCRTLQGGSDAG